MGMACRNLHEWFGSSITTSIYYLSYTSFLNLELHAQAVLNLFRFSEYVMLFHASVPLQRWSLCQNITPSSYFLGKWLFILQISDKFILTCKTFQTFPKQFGYLMFPVLLFVLFICLSIHLTILRAQTVFFFVSLMLCIHPFFSFFYSFDKHFLYLTSPMN